MRYNSAVFSSLASSDYVVAVVSDAFLTNGTWNLQAAQSRGLGDPGWSWVVDGDIYPRFGWKIPSLTPEATITAMQQNATSSYTHQDVSKCFATYYNYWSAVGNVVIVAKNQSVQAQSWPSNDTLLIYASIIPNLDDWAKNQWALENGTVAAKNDLTKAPVGTITTWYLGPEYYEVDYCLVQPPVTTTLLCRFEFSSGIMVTICILNLAKSIVMFFTWLIPRWRWNGETEARQSRKETLYTLGDAIASFMSYPDETTKNMSLATKDNFRSTRPFSNKNRFRKKEPPPYSPKIWNKEDTRWAMAASLSRWMFLIAM